MNKLKQIDMLLNNENEFENYILNLEKENSYKVDFSKEILSKIEDKESVCNIAIYKKKYSALDFLKIACVTIIITFISNSITSCIYAKKYDNKLTKPKQNITINQKINEFNEKIYNIIKDGIKEERK